MSTGPEVSRSRSDTYRSRVTQQCQQAQIAAPQQGRGSEGKQHRHTYNIGGGGQAQGARRAI